MWFETEIDLDNKFNSDDFSAFLSAGASHPAVRFVPSLAPSKNGDKKIGCRFRPFLPSPSSLAQLSAEEL